MTGFWGDLWWELGLGKCMRSGQRRARNNPSHSGTTANMLELIHLLSFYFLLACFQWGWIMSMSCNTSIIVQQDCCDLSWLDQDWLAADFDVWNSADKPGLQSLCCCSLCRGIQNDHFCCSLREKLISWWKWRVEVKCISLISPCDLVFADSYAHMDYAELGMLYFGFSHLNLSLLFMPKMNLSRWSKM